MAAATTSELLIFKTSISDEQDINRITELLDEEPRIHDWNVDVQDVDHVLRVHCSDLDSNVLIAMIRDSGFACDELPD